MEIQNVTFAKKHESLIASGCREISSRENQESKLEVRNYFRLLGKLLAVKITWALNPAVHVQYSFFYFPLPSIRLESDTFTLL
jgi:hypothetical protein